MTGVNISYNNQLHFFLIWNHGLTYENQILDILEQEFEIIKIVKHRDTKLDRLIKNVYNFDYAPKYHLKLKTKYLKRLDDNLVCFIFIRCKKGVNTYYGNGEFRHLENSFIKLIKSRIRNEFNPRDSRGGLLEEHVIHASDNSDQTDTVLKYLGYKKGIEAFERTLFSVPDHILLSNKLQLKCEYIKDLWCFNIVGEKVVHMKISESVQYRSITNLELYRKYLMQNRGWTLKDHYSVNKYLNLINKFRLNEYNPVIVKVINGYVTVVDGLHRCSVLHFKKIEKVRVLYV
ncbi:hypothetical protein [Halobacteriovorax sp. CON-3]|uniref:hypothetical protein n=1 Tax=Halobacteriovorax sp. CON-3 TaxID=3157710 RepID=UPI00371F753E